MDSEVPAAVTEIVERDLSDSIVDSAITATLEDRPQRGIRDVGVGRRFQLLSAAETDQRHPAGRPGAVVLSVTKRVAAGQPVQQDKASGRATK